MAQLDEPLPKWLRKVVRLGLISEPKAYLLHWHSLTDEEWNPLPECLHPEAKAIWLLELRQEGPTQ